MKLRHLLTVFAAANTLLADDLSRLLPPETQSVAAIDAARLRANPRWPLLHDIARLARGFSDPAEATGFDLSTDLDELALIQVGGETAAGALVMLRGRFDHSKIAHFDPANPEGQETRYRGIRVCTPAKEASGDGYHQWTASIGDLIVIGPAELVRTAIDSYLARGPRPSAFGLMIEQVRGRFDAWAVGSSRIQMLSGEDRAMAFDWSGGVLLDSRPSVKPNWWPRLRKGPT